MITDRTGLHSVLLPLLIIIVITIIAFFVVVVVVVFFLLLLFFFVHSLLGRKGNQMSARRGRSMFINRAMHLCNPPFLLNRERNGVAYKNMFTSTTSLQKDFVTLVLSF